MAARSEPLILASASAARAAVLRGAGIEFDVEPANIDEGITKRQARTLGWSAAACAGTLAIRKAMAVLDQFPQALVIGADQILAVGETWFDKPRDLVEARSQLESLRGCTHVLATAVCVACEGDLVWQTSSEPELTMRRFSDAFLEEYLAAEGESLLQSVGGYRLEGMGAQLFERINGDYFAVLGLPLLELLGFLRERGITLT